MTRGAPGENIERTQKERKTNAPQPLPLQRPRALTSTCGFPIESKQQVRTSDQSQSLLFGRLAKEIRQQIWTEVLGGHLLHIARAPKRLLAIECSEVRNSKPTVGRHGCWGIPSRPRELGYTPGFYHSPMYQHPAKPANLLPLLQTCRRVYLEAISIIYTDNVFDINHIDTLLYLQQSVLPQRLSQIRTLNLSWCFQRPLDSAPVPYDLETWREACNVLATSCTGLRELTVNLTGSAVFWQGIKFKDKWGAALDALMPIKASKLDVLLPWSEEGCVEAAEDGRYSFRLVSKL